MTLRHCDACAGWHDLADAWPLACSKHYQRERPREKHAKRSDIYDGVMVQRGRWIQCRKTGNMLPADEWYKLYGSPTIGLQIIKDIDPYKSIIDGSIIGGRKQHRDMLRARNMVEVGNDKISKNPPKRAPMPDAIPDIKRAWEAVQSGNAYRPRLTAQQFDKL